AITFARRPIYLLLSAKVPMRDDWIVYAAFGVSAPVAGSNTEESFLRRSRETTRVTFYFWRRFACFCRFAGGAGPPNRGNKRSYERQNPHGVCRRLAYERGR